MKIWVYVEGKSDQKSLAALWDDWSKQLRQRGWGINLIPLQDKSRYFRKIGARVAEKLTGDTNDLVVGLPDFYPNKEYAKTRYKHDNLRQLQDVQKRLVKKSLHNMGYVDENSHMQRFYASALKHDLEMLLLAAEDKLQAKLKTKRKGRWIKPPENQNQARPPKNIVKELFQQHLNRAYRETSDAAAILRTANLRQVIYDSNGSRQCPEFQSMLDWVGEKTGVAAYQQ